MKRHETATKRQAMCRRGKKEEKKDKREKGTKGAMHLASSTFCLLLRAFCSPTYLLVGVNPLVAVRLRLEMERAFYKARHLHEPRTAETEK